MEEGSVDLENVGVTSIFNLLVTNYQHEFFPAGFILFRHQATYLPFPYSACLPYHSVQSALSSNIPLRSGLLRTTIFTFLPPFNTASNKPKLFNFNLYHQYSSISILEPGRHPVYGLLVMEEIPLRSQHPPRPSRVESEVSQRLQSSSQPDVHGLDWLDRLNAYILGDLDDQYKGGDAVFLKLPLMSSRKFLVRSLAFNSGKSEVASGIKPAKNTVQTLHQTKFQLMQWCFHLGLG